MQKVKMAEEIFKEHPSYGDADLCFIASKHAIQMALAMKGLGYSSKVSVLLSLAEKHLDKEIAKRFRKLFNLYVKSEYGMEFLTEEEAKLAVEYAKKIMEVYKSLI
jgi:HEPN domain-containing protein